VLGPIFNREFLTVPRRTNHYLTRAAYLGTLWIICVTAWMASGGLWRSQTLGETARLGPLLFQILAYVELALFLFFAALSAASTVSQEKDRRTFILLLITDLRNIEIVLGKLLGSLLPIALLLAATLPLLMLLVLLGGVDPRQVGQAILIVAATSLAAGSLGGLIALWRDRTFQALALTVLFLVLYLCLVNGLAALPALVPQLSAAKVERWQEWLDPLAALRSVLDPATQLELGISPAYGFTLVMIAITVLLNLWGLLRLRVWNPSGEPIMQREQPEDAEDKERTLAGDAKARVSVHAAPGPVRRVGPNPILWRETDTRAYGRRPLLVKIAYFVVLAFMCWFALSRLLMIQHERLLLVAILALILIGALLLLRVYGWHPLIAKSTGFVALALLFIYLLAPQPKVHISFAAAYGLIPVSVLSLLLVAAQAVTAITSERDTGALDLLLVTDLTAKEFIFGKLGGIAYNTIEYLLPPLLLISVYAHFGYLASPPANHPELRASMNATSFICISGAGLVLLAFAMLLGIHVALRTPNSRMAIIHTLSTIFFLSVGTLVCVALILINGRFEYQWGSFVFFLVAGVGGLWWVLSGDRPSGALTWASWFCPLAVLYTVMNILVAKPGSQESADPLIPFLVISGAFGFAVAAMLVPLVSEFDVAMGRTSGGAD
jgi:ABC-type transport system involved in multi-copper enzyme maturation permease subunit